MVASEIAKTLYAPQKAFREISQNPRYLGPVLVMLLFVAANTGFAYAAISRTYIEQVLPDGSKLDEWTDNRTFWSSNGQISESNDFINGTYYGNKSIEFSVINSQYFWAELNDIGSINCSEPNGYPEMSCRLKFVGPDTEPVNATIYMFSKGPSDYFYKNLNKEFEQSTAEVWNNITIPLGSNGWSSNSSNADWNEVTGLRLALEWATNTNITLRIDGLFFHGTFKLLLESAGTAYLLNYALLAVMQFVITWVFLSGIVYIMSKSFGGQLVWKTMLVLVGFALVTMPVQAAINAVAYSSISAVYYPYELIVGAEGEADVFYNAILDQTATVSYVGRFTQIAVYIWTIVLCSLAVRVLTAFSSIKSVLIGVVAYLITILVIGFILGI